MNKFRFTIQMLAVATFLFAAASFAQAQATRTWVSGVGDDANPCSRTAPCKTFAGAISKTAAGGEIDALDPGGFGVVTITKSITIDGSGTFASILSSGSPSAVNINDSASGSPNSINVILRGLSINGTGTTLGVNGINLVSGKSVNVIDCLIQNFSGTGILVNLNSTVFTQIGIVNTVVKRCGGDGMSLTNAGTGPTKFAIERSSFLECGNGLHVKATTQGTARNSVFSLNTGDGVLADATPGGSFAVARIWTSQISGNGGNGVHAGTGADAGQSVIEISQNQIDQNAGNGALVGSGGVINTFTNNSIQGNGTNGCPSCTASGPGN